MQSGRTAHGGEKSRTQGELLAPSRLGGSKVFYSVNLSADGNQLAWKMSPVLRTAIGAALASVAAMLIWSLEPGDFAESAIIGKVNLIAIPILLVFGVCYEHSVVLDRNERWIETRSGLIFWKRRHRWRADQMVGLEYRVVRARGRNRREEAGGGDWRTRTSFGFQMQDRLILLDRSVCAQKARLWLQSFRAFWPDPVPLSS